MKNFEVLGMPANDTFKSLALLIRAIDEQHARVVAVNNLPPGWVIKSIQEYQP